VSEITKLCLNLLEFAEQTVDSVSRHSVPSNVSAV